MMVVRVVLEIAMSARDCRWTLGREGGRGPLAPQIRIGGRLTATAVKRRSRSFVGKFNKSRKWCVDAGL